MAGRKEIAEEVWRSLRKQYRVMRKCLPLMIGVTEELIRRHPEIDVVIMGSALRMHFGSHYYRRAVSKGGHRYGLDGNPCGEVSEEARADAAEKYQKWIAKRKSTRANQALEKERLLAKLERTSQQNSATTLHEKPKLNPETGHIKVSGSSSSGVMLSSKDGAKKKPGKI